MGIFKMSVNNSGLRFISLCLFSMVVVTAFQPRYYQLNSGNDASTNCTNCKANMSTLGKFLASYEVMAAQLEECNKNVTKLWPAMAKGLFSSNKAQGMVCQAIKKCNATATASHSLRPLLKELNQKDDPMCDACNSFVATTAKWMQTNDSIALSKGFWNGTDFCGAAKPIIPTSDCQGFVAWFTEPALMTLGEVMKLSTKAVCQVGFNLCH